MASNQKSVGIVGGGMLGMTLALRLAQNGFKVTLLEASETLGGLAAPFQIGPYTWDRFYHVILLSDSHLLGLLEELKLREQVRWGRTRTGFYTDGRLYSMSNLFEFLTFPPLRLTDKIRLGWTIFYASRIKAWQHLEKLPVTEWLTRHSGKRTYERIWLPLLKSKLGESYTVVNAAFIWAIIARMYAARRSGLKQEMFGYVEGGYRTVLQRLRTKLDGLGVRTLLNARVLETRCDATRVGVNIAAKDSLQFDSIILTIPCHQIAQTCPELTLAEKERLYNVKYEGVICLALVLQRPLAGYYVTNITEPYVPFTAVIEMTSLVDRNYLDGNSLIYLPLYLDHDRDLWGRSDEEIETTFLKGLASMYPSLTKRDVLYSAVARAKYVLPVTTLNYSNTVLPPTRTSLENLFVVNSAQIANGTMNVNEVVGLANNKAEELTRLLSN